jgi:hypothetical protein
LNSSDSILRTWILTRCDVSRILTPRDQAMEYVDGGYSIVPLVPHGKEPLWEALPFTYGKPSWIPLQTHALTGEDVGMLFADYGPEMGGAGFNVGLVTGYPGPVCLYVVDVDRPIPPPSLIAWNTTTVQTGRPGGGWHFYCKSDPGIHKQTVTIDGTSCEFKGLGAYVVAPMSVHASGASYTFIEERHMSAIKDVRDGPRELMKQLEADFLSDVPRGRGPDCRGRACLEQIWQRPLLEGERGLSLYALYQGLITARQSEGYARQWVKRKNAMLAVPLTDQELLKITMHGPEAKRPGHIYGIGCHWTRANLTWLDCRDCRYANREALHMVNAYELEQVQRDATPSVLSVYIALVRAESNTGVRYLSLSELQEQTSLSRTAVSDGKQWLKGKGLL